MILRIDINRWFAMAPKMAAKLQKSSDLGKIWFPSRFFSYELISVISFGIGSHVMILQIISYLLIIFIILPVSASNSSASILSGKFLGDALIKLYETL